MRALVTPLTFLVVALPGRAVEQQPSAVDVDRLVAELHASYVSANVPPDATFTALLQRDVRADLVTNRLPSDNL